MVQRKLIQFLNSSQSLAEALPWLDPFIFRGDDYVLLRNGNVLAMAEILSCEAWLASDEQLSDTRRVFHAIVQGLPVGTSISITMVRRRAEPATLPTDPEAGTVVRYLRKRQEAFWNARRHAMYENRVLLCLEQATQGLSANPGAAAWEWFKAVVFGSGRSLFNEESFVASLETFHQTLHGVLDNMAGVARLKLLGRDEVLRWLYFFLNPHQRDERSSLSYNPSLTLARQVCSAHFNDSGEELCREDNGTAGPSTLFRVLNLNMLPAAAWPAFFDSLSHLGSSRPDERVSEFWVTQHYTPASPNAFLAGLNMRQNIGNAVGSSKMFRNVAQKSVALAQDAAAVTDAIQRDKEGVGHFSMVLTLYDRDAQRLGATAGRVLTGARAKNCGFLVESRFARFAAFLTSLPGGSGLCALRSLNYRRAPVLCANFADLAMIHREDEGDSDGAVVFETPEGSFFRYHPFSSRATSWNTYVSGTTGSGKSFFQNLVVESALSFRPYVYILDVGNSYDPVVKMLPGAVKIAVDFSNPDLALNPFSFPKAPDQAERVTLTHLIEHLITGGTRQPGQAMRVDLMDALSQTLDGYDPKKPPVLEDYFGHLEKLNAQLAKPLRLWLPGGPYASFFNHERDSFRQAQVSYFELTGFDDHPDVASALVFLLFNKIFSRLQDPKDQARKKMIVLDECWKFLMNEVMAARIKELYRTIRKHNGSVTTITQHPNDLILSPHRDAILANTSFYFFLEQKAVGNEAAEAFALNPREFQVLKDIRMVKGRFSELLIKGPYRRQVRVLADPYLYWLNTTDPTERNRRDALAAEQGGLEAALDILAGQPPVPRKGEEVHVA